MPRELVTVADIVLTVKEGKLYLFLLEKIFAVITVVLGLVFR